MLPCPLDEINFDSRWEYYNEKKEEGKKQIFNVNNYFFYFRSRNCHFEALRRIFFVVLEESLIKKIKPEYGFEEYKKNILEVIICIQKIAESNYFLDRNGESLDLCETNLEVFKWFNKKHPEHPFEGRCMVLTYNLMGLIYLEMKELWFSRKWIEKGLDCDPTSRILQTSEEYLEHEMKGENYESIKSLVNMGSMKWGSKEHLAFEEELTTANRIKIPPIEEYLRYHDDFLHERLHFFVRENFITREAKLYLSIKFIHGSKVYVWKSLLF